MRAAIYQHFKQPITVQTVPDPEPSEQGVVIAVKATGICRSDWHGWMGHDPDISLPHVPGHELAGTVVATGKAIRHWQKDDRVTLPFVCGCGNCPQCFAGQQQVCDHQFQLGFTHWGSFAEYVAVDYADLNLVRLPESIDFVTVASLGCRFVTAFRALLAQGRLSGGQWLAVHGCGGVGLSAIMIGHALGARVVAIDISAEKLEFARSLGADHTINASTEPDVITVITEISQGGAHVSIDALGSPVTCFNSIAGLRKQGKHVQVGLLLGEHARTAIPMDLVIAKELEIYGSHGMQAHQYSALLQMIETGHLQPQKLVGKTVDLATGVQQLMMLNEFKGTGITVINRF